MGFSNDLQNVINLVGKMNRKNLIIFCAVIIIAAQIATPAKGAEVKPSEKDLYNAAYDDSIKKDYQKAIDTLNQLLLFYPDTKNEDVYWKIAEIYDSNLHDFAKAVAAYQMYLRLFPDGRFGGSFQERLAYLSKNKPDWDVLKEYKTILDTYYTRKINDNINFMENLLKKYPATSLTPDIYNWLASQYYSCGKTQSALFYIQKYLSTFPANQKSDNEAVTAYKQYSQILILQRKYPAAIVAINQALRYKISATEYQESVNLIKKEWRIWTGLEICLAYFGLVLLLILLIKPWRELNFYRESMRLMKWLLLLLLFTLGPLLAVSAYGYGIWKAFYGLAVCSGVVLVLIKFLSVSTKINHRLYVLISFLLAIAGIYLAYYWGDTLSVFYQPPGM
jgi:outer membrane protein assembly factor BamD (BamD/ComL family)